MPRPGTQRAGQKEEAKGKSRILLPAASAWGCRGFGSFWAALAAAAGPGATCSSLGIGAAEPLLENGDRAVQAYRNDIKIQTGGSLLPSALLALLEIEL